LWHPNEGISHLSWDSSFEAQLLTMSGAIIAFSTSGNTGLRQPKQGPLTPKASRVCRSRVSLVHSSLFKSLLLFLTHIEFTSSWNATERAQETWRTSGRPYCSLAHRSCNDGEAHDTKMCAFLNATRGGNPKFGSTSDGYRTIQQVSLVLNGVNRASSCISGVALPGLLVGTFGASWKCSTPITNPGTGR
jgi:hypothetical protein